MNKLQKSFILAVSSGTADALLAGYTYTKMKARLLEKREDGWDGWHNNCTIDELYDRLKKNVKSRSWIDVINLAAMIMVKEKLNVTD